MVRLPFHYTSSASHRFRIPVDLLNHLANAQPWRCIAAEKLHNVSPVCKRRFLQYGKILHDAVVNDVFDDLIDEIDLPVVQIRPIESTILIALYYALQSTGGGFHASTHLRCFISMAVGMILFLFSLRFYHFLPLYLGLALIASILLWRYPLILHPNKRHLAQRAQKCVIRSRCITLSCIVLLLISILFKFSNSITQTFAFALICGAVSRATARVQHKSLVFR